MSKIQILPENLANKIAAGEVVQRPESVVKELLENSIDAESKNIELIIKKAGKVLIQVCDDGLGMSEEDAILCIQKHATSKISTYQDLEDIRTLGFRGEALSSISSVSQFEIKTETRDQELGTLIRIEGENNIQTEKGSFPKGTTTTVKNLFYNIPARRNFLKTDATEFKHIIDTFNKIALSHPELSFKLWNDDDLVCNYPESDLSARIQQVFSDNMIDALIPVSEMTEFMNISGFIGKPSMLKKSKGDQYLFLNNRYVISRQISHAVFSAYENILEKGDYPFFILFVELDPRKVDINVHPSKLEVRFEDEKDIYSFVLAVIRKSLGGYDLIPSMAFAPPRLDEQEKLQVNNFVRVQRNDFSDRPVFEKQSYAKTNFSDREVDLLFGSLNKEITSMSKTESAFPPFEETRPVAEPQQLAKPSWQNTLSNKEENTSFIIQLHNKYILSQIKTGLMIIDQHVAHERILYEKAINLMDANMPFSQQLLFPKTVQLDAGSLSVLKEIYPLLLQLGFGIRFQNKSAVVIEGVPQDIKQGSEEKILLEIIEEYQINQREKGLEERDNIAKSYSCKTAIKTGDRLSDVEMRSLIDQLFATSMPYVCPHGRPIVIKISLEEFDRRFGRT
jgi:DNA mismatch repair protein MutL